MSDDKQRKPEPRVNGQKTAAKTIVGVPSLPASRPSDQELTREMPAPGKMRPEQQSVTLVGGEPPDPDSSEENTSLDVKAMSSAEAERVLARTGFSQEEVPTAQGSPPSSGAAKGPGLAGALPKPAKAGPPVKTPPLGGAAFKTAARTTVAGVGGSRSPFDKPTRPGIAPQPGISRHGRSTLLLDSSAPGSGGVHDADASAERPPIVVPSSASTPPKAVTQPPPWGEGAVRVSPSIPRGAPPPRARGPAIEEISASLLLPADSTGQVSAGAAEELSGSLLIEDAPDGKGPPVVKPATAPPVRVSSMPPPVPGSSSKRPPPALPHSSPPPVPQPTSSRAPAAPAAAPSASARPPAAATRTLAMPELPRATPGPKLDFVSAPPADIPIPEPVPDPIFPSTAWPPPPSPADTVGAPGTPGTPPPPGGAAAHASAHPPSPPSAMTGDIELTQLPRGGLAPVIDRARAMLAKLGPAVRRVGPALRKLEPLWRKLQQWLQKLAPAAGAMLSKLPKTSALQPETRPKWFLPAIAVAGLVVGIGLVGLVISLVRKGGDDAAEAAASTSASAHASALPSAAPAPSSAAAPAPAALPACTVAGAPRVIAPSAIVAAGVEVVPVRDDIGVGFAPSDREAMAVRLDVGSLAATATAKAHSADPVRRVTPITTTKGTLSLLVDADKKNDAMQGRRAVLADPPLQLGAADGALSWAKVGGPPAGKLWPLDGSAGVDALRGAVESASAGDRTMAVAFRRDAAVWVGTATGTPLVPKGDLAHVDGLGTSIGSPAIALSDGVALVAWSDRASSDEPWHLRWVRFAAGQAPGAAQTFTPPAGGKGSQAMSPGLAAVPGGRFLLVWTEGPAEGHDVRALTLGPDGQPLGAPLVISNAGINAGQGQAALTATGEGVVAFLESGGSGFQVVATPIHCAL